MALNYSSYLKVEELLQLQQPLADPPQHDEMLFIVIHQTYELWFRQLLHELDRLGGLFERGELFPAIAAFKRVRTIMKTLVGQLDILETMTPLSFASFRDRLETASGFQSTQFRELEFLLGFKRADALRYMEPDWPGTARARRRYEEPTLIDRFYRFLGFQGVGIPRDLLERDVREPNAPHEGVQEGVLRLYRERPDLAILFESMTDFDEGLQEWRYRHVKIVERTIGAKKGTGGSPGVAFLKKSLFHAVFPDLWAIRHEF